VTLVLVAWAAIVTGVRFAFQFNPIVALVTAVLGAALNGYPKAGRNGMWRAGFALAFGWVIGDGLLILGRARDFADGAIAIGSGGPAWAGWVTLAIWALGSLGIGYVAPALAGGAVGRRVTVGTGWLAAAVVAGTLVLSVSAAVGALS